MHSDVGAPDPGRCPAHSPPPARRLGVLAGHAPAQGGARRDRSCHDPAPQPHGRGPCLSVGQQPKTPRHRDRPSSQPAQLWPCQFLPAGYRGAKGGGIGAAVSWATGGEAGQTQATNAKSTNFGRQCRLKYLRRDLGRLAGRTALRGGITDLQDERDSVQDEVVVTSRG
jgi:hypothetical protein